MVQLASIVAYDVSVVHSLLLGSVTYRLCTFLPSQVFLLSSILLCFLFSTIDSSPASFIDYYGSFLLTLKIYNYQGVVNEDYNIVNTPAPNGELNFMYPGSFVSPQLPLFLMLEISVIFRYASGYTCSSSPE